MDQSHPMKTINKDGKPYVSVVDIGHAFDIYNHHDRKLVQMDKKYISDLIVLLKDIDGVWTK
jgi:hypothetical protein